MPPLTELGRKAFLDALFGPKTVELPAALELPWYIPRSRQLPADTELERLKEFERELLSIGKRINPLDVRLIDADTGQVVDDAPDFVTTSDSVSGVARTVNANFMCVAYTCRVEEVFVYLPGSTTPLRVRLSGPVAVVCGYSCSFEITISF